MAGMIETRWPRVVIIVGPTGAGKSELALELAEAFGGEIINADSMQVYRHMDVGTAKPTREEQKRVVHHLIDIVNPDQAFHAALYRTLGRKTIDLLHEQQKPIWVVGGTGLYIKSLTQGLFASPRIDPRVRENLKQEARLKGEDFLYQRLNEVDPKTASKLHPHDLVRTIRALEVFDATGVPISFFREQHGFGERSYHTLKIGVERNREELYRRIDQRVDRMVEQGFLQEVQGLLDMGYGAELNPMQSLGYKQMVRFVRNEMGWDEAIREIKRDTRRYAKRQWTWFKSDAEIGWRDGGSDRQTISREVRAFLEAGEGAGVSQEGVGEI
jgi:tRNA dimethylallyltransferase